MSWRFLRRCHDLRLAWLERRVQRCPDDLSQRCAAALQHCKAAEVEEKEMHLGEAQRHLEVVLHKSEEPDLQEFLHKVMVIQMMMLDRFVHVAYGFSDSAVKFWF